MRLVVSRCFAALRQLRLLRRYVSDDCFQSLVVVLVHSCLDYGNFILVGEPAYRLRQLQAVLNAAARLTLRLGRYDHITDSLIVLHWLRVPERVDFRLAVGAYCVLQGVAPGYLNVLQRTADLASRRSLRSSASDRLEVPVHRLSTVGRRSFSVASPILWNSFLFMYNLRRRCLRFELGSKHFSSGSPFRTWRTNLTVQLTLFSGACDGNCYFAHFKNFSNNNNNNDDHAVS